MTMMKILTDTWFGPWLVAGLCVLIVIPALPQKGEATLIELLVTIAVIAVLVDEEPFAPNPGDAWGVLGNQLQTSVAGAIDADSNGDEPKVFINVVKALGAAEAMMGMTSSCNTSTCDHKRSLLQQIIGGLASVKSSLLGVSSTCNPNGVVQGNEQCDPSAVPNGCPTGTTERLFCNDECQCQVSP